jgi:hypothetical protein
MIDLTGHLRLPKTGSNLSLSNASKSIRCRYIPLSALFIRETYNIHNLFGQAQHTVKFGTLG